MEVEEVVVVEDLGVERDVSAVLANVGLEQGVGHSSQSY